MEVSVMPNPAANNFNVSVISFNNKPISIRVIDLTGRIVQQFSKVLPGQTISLGAGYYPGVYILEAMQGTERKTLKLIKTAR
jgi:hypothetical protein